NLPVFVANLSTKIRSPFKLPPPQTNRLPPPRLRRKPRFHLWQTLPAPPRSSSAPTMAKLRDNRQRLDPNPLVEGQQQLRFFVPGSERNIQRVPLQTKQIHPADPRIQPRQQ